MNDHNFNIAKLKGLYAITDPTLLPGDELLSGVESALKGGARLVQYRDKSASSIQNTRNAENLRTLTKQYEAALIINDDMELCLKVKADGVHLGKQDGNVETARKKLGAYAIIGATCHSDIKYAKRLIALGVDYCAFGRIYTSQTKSNAPACPIEVLSEAAKLPCSTLAIGGITTENSAALLPSGVDMLAAIHGLFGQDDIQAAARSFSRLFN